MFSTVLVANRGEIARRIIRTLDALGIDSVAVYSEGDADAPHVREATRAVCIGPDPAHSSYLRVVNIIEAALKTGAEAIHPGYGFLSESTELASACAESGITFIGPGTHALEIMGDKVRARDHLEGTGVPMVPGFADTRDGARLTDAEITEQAVATGFPLLVKPSAGGGGKGMEVARNEADLPEAFATARRLAQSAFGDDTLLIERLIERPRHIEVQVFGTASSEILSLGERECTLQRRHQKVIEESPNAGGISAETVLALEVAAARVAASVNYVGAGTVEFLVNADRPDEFFFIEMNTRLQVEHPVTEMVLGLDLVELQVRTAAGANVVALLRDTGHDLAPLVDDDGERIGWRLAPAGHAVEARVYAESPERGFLPSVGTILAWDEPAEARVDSAVGVDDRVSSAYDPMIAKVITHGATRDEALASLDRALGVMSILGVETNVRFLRALVTHDRVRAGDLDTGLIETMLPFAAQPPPHEVLREVAQTSFDLNQWEVENFSSSTLWHKPGHTERFRLRTGTDTPKTTVTLLDELDTEHVVEITRGRDPMRRVDHDLTDVNIADVSVAVEYDETVEHLPIIALWAGHEGNSWKFRALSRRDRTMRSLSGSAATRPDSSAALMPGSVTRIHVDDGAYVSEGDALVSIEAMKMEHPTRAPHDGIVRIHVALGDQVAKGQELASVEPAGTSDEQDTDTLKGTR